MEFINENEPILFVDDDQNLLDAISRQLRRRFKIETAAGTAAGLEAIRRNPVYAVVVSDMRMPEMEGVTFLSRVKELLPESIRIMLTGYPDVETAVEAVNQGSIFRFLTKPCSTEVLGAALESALEQRRLQRSRVELLETRLRSAQQLELMGRCAAGVYHDLKNILTIISLHADLALNRKDVLPEHLLGPFQQIRQAASNAVKLTQQLVSLGRPRNRVSYAPLDLVHFVTGFTEMLRHIFPKSIALTHEFGSDLPPVRGDAGMLGQVLLNLALNARDAMPSGGSLVLRVQGCVLGPETIPAGILASSGQFVRLSLTDSGCGMDTEVRNRLFEPFFTTKAEGVGTGLGLSMVAEVVRQHGGWLEVRSQPGRGTTFHLLLPAWAEEAAGVEPGAGLGASVPELAA